MTEDQLRVLDRLSSTPEGVDFFDRVIAPMVVKNYNQLLGSSKEYRDELVGYGLCLRELRENYLASRKKLTVLSNTTVEEWL